MSLVTIKAEVLVGTSIDRACSELCRAAARLGINVSADFNGVEVIAGPDTDFKELARAYHRELRHDHSVKLAIA